MELPLEKFFTQILYLLPLLVLMFYKYHTINYNYWKRRGIPYKGAVFPFGSLKSYVLGKTHTGKAYDDVYKEFEGERFFGLIENGKPSLVIRDPELVKKILVKDFQHFVNRATQVVVKDAISKNLALLSGNEWREMRHKLTPTFTSGKMKMMFVLIEKCSDQLKEFLVKTVVNNKPVDAKDVLGRFTMDIIAACAFGLDTNSLAGNSEFVDKLGGMMKMSKPPFVAQMVLMFVPLCLLRILPVKLTKPEVRQFLIKVVQDAVQYRVKNNITRNDFLDLLIKIRQNKSLDEDTACTDTTSPLKHDSAEGLTIEQMTAQAFVFFIAGFETASSLMSFCLFELSRNQDIQETLYRELQEAVNRNNGKITYQLLMDIPYLDQVIDETLRLYGSVSVLTRTCTKAYQIPDSHLVLQEGLRVVIPSYSLHHDPQYYPNPYQFKPERFSPEQSKERHPYVFLPFGDGPRNCIGMRFGLMQTKVGLATVLLNFQVQLAPEQEIPIEISSTSVVTQPENPVWLNFSQRQTTN